MKKYVVGLAILILGGFMGVYMYNKPVENISKLKTDLQIEASSLLAAFEANEKDANEKYLDKVIEVHGPVLKVETKNGKQTIFLDADNLMSNVIFQLEHLEEGVKVGEDVTLKGICTGYLMDVVLIRAIKV